MNKIKYSIELLRKTEKLALQYNDFGYHLGFSGGKDSQVIYRLAEISGVKFKAFFYKTSVDTPELLKFIKKNYPLVEWIKPEKTLFQIIEDNKCLPMRNIRFCCRIIKERQGVNAVVVTGQRAEESWQRAKRKEFEITCINGKDKMILKPIFKWTSKEVYTFLKNENIQLCSLYNKFHRIGCVGCPFDNKKQRKEFELYPNFKKAYLNTIKKIMDRGAYKWAKNENEVLEWWLSGKNKKQFIYDNEKPKLL